VAASDRWMTLTIRVHPNAIEADDWRDDPRWDAIVEFAAEQFHPYMVDASGVLEGDG